MTEGTAAKQTGAPSPALIFDMLMAFQRSAALRAAIELDLFRWIGEGNRDTKSLAERCNASERGIRILCDFLTLNGILVKDGPEYGHSPASALFLDPRSPASVASVYRFLSTPTISEPFNHLADIVRSGRTSLPGDGSVEAENPAWVEFAHSIAPMMAPMAAPLGKIVMEGTSGDLRVLDIAAGHGLFGIEVARQAPGARVTSVDWASVLEVARANAQKASRRALRDAARKRLRCELRRPLRYCAAHQLPASLRHAHLRGAAEKGTRRSQAGGQGCSPGVRTQ